MKSSKRPKLRKKPAAKSRLKERKKERKKERISRNIGDLIKKLQEPIFSKLILSKLHFLLVNKTFKEQKPHESTSTTFF